MRPLDFRIILYDEVRRLRQQGLSYTKIIEVVEKEYGVKLLKSHISEWLRGLRNPRNSVKLLPGDLKPSEELAYIIGVIAGDGTIYMKDGKCILYLMCKDSELAMEFARCLKVLRCKPRVMIRGGFYIVRAYSKALCELLKKPLDLEKLRPYMEYGEKTIAKFLRAFFDSEGSVDVKGKAIYISNTNLDLLNYVKKLLLMLRIDVEGPHLYARMGTTIYKPNKIYYRKKDAYRVYVRASSRQTFTELVGFTIKRKMERLRKLLKPLPTIFPQNIKHLL